MKKSCTHPKSIANRNKMFLFVAIIFSITSSCAWLWSDPIDDETQKKMDAYATVSNYHTLKQMVLIEYYALFSNDFQNEMFELFPTGNDKMEFWNLLQQLYEVEANLDSALLVIDKKSGLSYQNDILPLKSIEAAKWDWLWKKVYWVGDRIEKREKLVKFFNNAGEKNSQEAYEYIVNNLGITGTSNVNEFISNLDQGQYDTWAFNFDKNLETYHSTYKNWKDDNGIPSNTEYALNLGKKGCEHATKLMTTTLKYSNPTVGTTVDVLEKVNSFCEYVNNFMSDESSQSKIEANLKENYKSFTDNTTEHAKSIVEQAQAISKVHTMNKNPTSTVVDYSNIDWGGLSVSIEDKAAEISTIIAERSSEIYDNIGPAILIYTDLVKNELGEWDIALPEGNWDFTTIDDMGNIGNTEETPILAGHFKMLEYDANLNWQDNIDDDSDNSDENIPEIDFEDYNKIYASLVYNWHSDYGNMTMSNSYSNNTYPLVWSNNNFNAQFEYTDKQYNHNYSFTFSGNITSDSNGDMFCSGKFIEIRTIDYSSLQQDDLIQTQTMNLNKIPLDRQTDTQLVFKIRIDYETQQTGININQYASFSYKEEGYRESYEENNFYELPSQWPTQYSHSVTITFTKQ